MQDYVETDYNTEFSSTFFYFQQCCMAWLLGEQSKKKGIVALNPLALTRAPRVLVNKWLLTCIPAAFA